MTVPRSFFASADEVNAYRDGALWFRRPVRSKSGLWVRSGDKPGPAPYEVGASVSLREPFADTESGRIYRADMKHDTSRGREFLDKEAEAISWRRPDALPVTQARFKFRVLDVRYEPLHTAHGSAEGVEATRFWTPKELDSRPFLEKWWDDCYFWSHYPRIAYSRWWDSMWARFGIGWDENPMTWVIVFRERDTSSFGVRADG